MESTSKIHFYSFINNKRQSGEKHDVFELLLYWTNLACHENLKSSKCIIKLLFGIPKLNEPDDAVPSFGKKRPLGKTRIWSKLGPVFIGNSKTTAYVIEYKYLYFTQRFCLLYYNS